MSKFSLSGRKFALMVAHGFDEDNFIALQKILMAQNAVVKIVSPHIGLVNGMKEGQVAMTYPVDKPFNEALAIDYDALIIPKGDAHIETLGDELHAGRIVRAFMRENMPIFAQGKALDMIAEFMPDIDVTALKAQGDMVASENLLWADEHTAIEGASRRFFEVVETLEKNAAVMNNDENGDSAAA